MKGISVDERPYQIKLDQSEVSLLWQLLNQVNIPGQVAEIFVGLKTQVREAMATDVTHPS